MKKGKIAQSVLKRSILKEIKVKREEVLSGAGVGRDCAVMEVQPGEVLVYSTNPITISVTEIGMYSMAAALNNIAATGAEPVGVLVSALLPEEIEEAQIKEMMRQIHSVCQEANVEVMGGHTEVTNAVNRSVLTVTGVGKISKEKVVLPAGAKPGDDLVLSKWIGLGGTSLVAKEKEEELRKRLPGHLIDQAKAFDAHLLLTKEAAIALTCGVHAMHDASEGGIFGALWEMAESAGVGLDVELRKIPVRQETIEICEFFEMNPYTLASGGCMLMAAADGNQLVQELRREGIEGTIIGKITQGNTRIIRNGEEARYLEVPQTDELRKVLN